MDRRIQSNLINYVKYRLDREIKNQFVTKKQNLLKTLFTYVAENSSNETEDSFSLFGTNAFHVVWEKVCAELFENMYAKNWTINQFAEKALIEKCYLNNENKGYVYKMKKSEFTDEVIESILKKFNITLKYDVDRIGMLTVKEDKKDLVYYCYLIETTSRYECVELKSDIMILSLDQYNQIYSKQGILGLIIMPIGFLICFIFPVSSFSSQPKVLAATQG